jgi:hypothetical protein
LGFGLTPGLFPDRVLLDELFVLPRGHGAECSRSERIQPINTAKKRRCNEEKVRKGDLGKGQGKGKNFFALALKFDDRSRILSSQPHLQSRAGKKEKKKKN